METKSFILATLCLLSISLAAYSQDYYWYNGEKYPLLYGNQQYILYEDHLLSESDKAQLVHIEDVEFSGVPDMKYGLTKPDAVIEDLEHVIYQTQSYQTDHQGRNMFVTHRFYVRLNKSDDAATLKELANQYHAVIEEENAVFALWYVLRWDWGCQYNALELANIFYETGLFSATEPEIIGAIFFDDNSATPHIAYTPSSSRKILRNGQLFINHDGNTYNANGVLIRNF